MTVDRRGGRKLAPTSGSAGDRRGRPAPLSAAGPARPGGGGTARAALLWALVLILIGWTVIAWPRLTLPFSSFAPMVSTLDTDVLYDGGVGLTEQQRADIRGAIGTRPVAMVYLSADGPDESEVCKAVSPRLPDLLVVIVKGDDGRYGCTGDKVPVINKGDVLDDMRGLAYEIRINAALHWVGDPVAKAQGVALVHDSMVLSGRLDEDERSLRTPWSQVLTTLLIVAGVLTAVLLVLHGLRLLALYLRAQRTRRTEQERVRDDLDDALAELALAVVDATPDDPLGDRGPGTDRAAGYVDLLGRARSARGGWAGLLREAQVLLDGKVRS